MRFSTPLTRRALTAGASALASTALLTGAAFAQDTTPASTPGGPPTGYEVGIYQGSCAELSSEPAFELDNAVSFGVENTEEPQTVGNAGGVTSNIYYTSGSIDSSLQTLADEGHAVAVMVDEGNGPALVSCGAVAGAVAEGRLPIALTPMEGSEVVGIAILEGEDQVEAQVYIFSTEVADPQATPAS